MLPIKSGGMYTGASTRFTSRQVLMAASTVMIAFSVRLEKVKEKWEYLPPCIYLTAIIERFERQQISFCNTEMKRRVSRNRT